MRESKPKGFSCSFRFPNIPDTAEINLDLFWWNHNCKKSLKSPGALSSPGQFISPIRFCRRFCVQLGSAWPGTGWGLLAQWLIQALLSPFSAASDPAGISDFHCVRLLRINHALIVPFQCPRLIKVQWVIRSQDALFCTLTLVFLKDQGDSNKTWNPHEWFSKAKWVNVMLTWVLTVSGAGWAFTLLFISEIHGQPTSTYDFNRQQAWVTFLAHTHIYHLSRMHHHYSSSEELNFFGYFCGWLMVQPEEWPRIQFDENSDQLPLGKTYNFVENLGDAYGFQWAFICNSEGQDHHVLPGWKSRTPRGLCWGWWILFVSLQEMRFLWTSTWKWNAGVGGQESVGKQM